MNLLDTNILVITITIGVVGLVAAGRLLPRLLAWLRTPPPAPPDPPVTAHDRQAPMQDPQHLNGEADPSDSPSGRRAS